MNQNQLIMKHMKVILGTDVANDIVTYINSMEHEEDLAEFMDNILDKNNKAHMTAFDAIRILLFEKNQKKPQKINKIEKGNSSSGTQTTQTHKGKKKFSDINTFQEKKRQNKGRQICDCEGQIHDFMNNCLNCGRIHCIKEGPGPCFFCSEFISVMGDDLSHNQKNKAKLLKPKENKVFDDDNDYFKSNNDKSHNDKRKMIIALDFASRKIIESTEEDERIKEKLHEDIKKHLENVNRLYKKLQRESDINQIEDNNNDLVDLLVKMRHRKPHQIDILNDTEDNSVQFINYGLKVYDEDIIASTDHGLCLSLHQPYASLLIAGVKKHEGRTWKTNHRGRLWIAAASKVPDDDEISLSENFYRQYYNEPNLKLPRDYPVSCLLGCVFIEDCLDQETYQHKYPKGESSSPYVLICSNPIILPIFYPIIGQHKIYPLDKELHNCAKLSIRHAIYATD